MALVAATALAGLGACGGDDDSGRELTKDEREAVQLGRTQCSVIGPALVERYKTRDIEVLARRYSEDFYAGLFPLEAALGCRQSLPEHLDVGSTAPSAAPES